MTLLPLTCFLLVLAFAEGKSLNSRGRALEERRLVTGLLRDSNPNVLPPVLSYDRAYPRDHPDAEPPTSHNDPEAAVEVKIGYDLITVNMVSAKGFADLTGFLMLSWNDPRLRWDGQKKRIESIRLSPFDIWTPDIELFNSVRPGTTVLNEKPLVVVYPSGNVNYIRSVATRSICNVIPQLKAETINCTLNYGSWTRHNSDLKLELMEKQELSSPDLPLDDFLPSGKWNAVSAQKYMKPKSYYGLPESYATAYFSFLLTKEKGSGKERDGGRGRGRGRN